MKFPAIAVAALVAAAVPLAAEAEALKITVGQKGVWNADFFEFAERNGFFKEAGLEVEIIYTAGGAATLQPVVAGDVDLGMTNGFLGVIGAYVKGAPIRVVSAESTGAGDLFWYAQPESGMRSLKDAADRTIAFSSPGSSSNLALLALLAQEHVSAKPVPTGEQSATMTQVMTGQIDIGWAVPPTGLKEIQDGKLVIVARGSEITSMRDETVRVNVANLDALTKKRDAITRLIEADAKAIDWAYRDPRAIDYFAEAQNVPRDIALKAVAEFFPKSTYQLNEVRGVQNVLDEAVATKRVPHAMKPEDIAGLFDILYQRSLSP